MVSSDPIFLLLVSIVLGGLFLYLAFRLGHGSGRRSANQEWQEQVPDIRGQAIKRSRAVIGGQFSENLAPYLPDFPFRPTECKFLGQPIDFLVFTGMDEKNISEVVFVEVKSGQAKLSSQERNLRDAVEAGRVRWVEYRVPEGLTG